MRQPAANPPPSGMRPAPPPFWRDPWAWLCVLAVIPACLRARTAPLGEPVADDFQYLYHELLVRRVNLMDGGGLLFYWRPLARQIYYRLFGPLMLSHPGWVSGLQAGLLGLAAMLLYRALRRTWPAPWAAAAATFPLLLSSTPMLIGWPSNFQDIGALLFAAFALHEAVSLRLLTALAALLAALLCKEIAVATALLLPWIPREKPLRGRARVVWIAGTAAVVGAWGLSYWTVRRHVGVLFPHDLPSSAAPLVVPWVSRFAWVLRNTLADAFNLADLTPQWKGLCAVSLGILALLAAAMLATSGSARRRLRGSLPHLAFGLLWYLMVIAVLPDIYPAWAPYRGAFALFGLGLAVTALLGSAHPALLAGLVAVRLVALGAGPGAPATVTLIPAESAAALDFPRLARLQLLLRETRHLLTERFPTLPHGALVHLHNMPRQVEPAFAGNQSLQVWYHDSTLRWVRFEEFRADPHLSLTAMVEYQRDMKPELAWVQPEAMRRLLSAVDDITHMDYRAALFHLDSADSLQTDPDARTFLATVAGKRAFCLAELGRLDPAETEALRGMRLWADNLDSRYVLAEVLFRRGRPEEAEARLDTLLALYPNDEGAAQLLARIRAARR